MQWRVFPTVFFFFVIVWNTSENKTIRDTLGTKYTLKSLPMSYLWSANRKIPEWRVSIYFFRLFEKILMMTLTRATLGTSCNWDRCWCHIPDYWFEKPSSEKFRPMILRFWRKLLKMTSTHATVKARWPWDSCQSCNHDQWHEKICPYHILFGWFHR